MSANRKVSSSTAKAAKGLPMTAILIVCILLLALFVRMLPVIYDISGGHVLFSGLDSYYHMRRIMYTVDHFPSTNVFDSYVNFPSGFPIYWPPLYDQISAGLSLLAGLGHPGSFTIELASALVPALIGVLSIIPLYLIVKDAMGKYAAMIAALIMAIIPGSVYQSFFGATDHHGLEVLLSLTMYLLFMRALSSANGVKPEDIIKQKKPLVYAALAGVAMAAMIFTWDGAPIFIGIIVFYSFVQYAYDAYTKERSVYLTIVGSVASLVALAIVMPFAATGNGGFTGLCAGDLMVPHSLSARYTAVLPGHGRHVRSICPARHAMVCPARFCTGARMRGYGLAQSSCARVLLRHRGRDSYSWSQATAF